MLNLLVKQKNSDELRKWNQHRKMKIVNSLRNDTKFAFSPKYCWMIQRPKHCHKIDAIHVMSTPELHIHKMAIIHPDLMDHQQSAEKTGFDYLPVWSHDLVSSKSTGLVLWSPSVCSIDQIITEMFESHDDLHEIAPPTQLRARDQYDAVSTLLAADSILLWNGRLLFVIHARPTDQSFLYQIGMVSIWNWETNRWAYGIDSRPCSLDSVVTKNMVNVEAWHAFGIDCQAAFMKEEDRIIVFGPNHGSEQGWGGLGIYQSSNISSISLPTEIQWECLTPFFPTGTAALVDRHIVVFHDKLGVVAFDINGRQ